MYRIRRFAELAGVTVKTLHHYDRLGLLRPLRTAAGYRVYRDADLQRIAGIAALKLVGIPLKHIRPLLDGDDRPLDDVLLAQRAVLEAKRDALDAAVRAIERAQRRRQAGESTEPEILKTLIEAIEMQNDINVLKGYFADDVWHRWREGHGDWPGAAWESLLRDVEAALDEDPTGQRGRGLAARWMARMEEDIGPDPAARTAFTKAWHEWVTRPQTRPRILSAFPTDRILRFIVDATSAHLDALPQSPELARVPTRTTPARLELFRDARALLQTSPDGPEAQALVDRLEAIFERELGDNAEVRAGMAAAWARRGSWPAGMIRWIAKTYDMDPETWTAVADFLDRARAARGAGGSGDKSAGSIRARDREQSGHDLIEEG